MCADVVWLVACATLLSRGSEATTHDGNQLLLHGDQGDPPDTIRFYINRTVSSNYDIEQCLSERSSYYLRPHQKLTVMILKLNKDEEFLYEYKRKRLSYCKWNGIKYDRNMSADVNVTGYWRAVIVEIMDIGNESGDLYYWSSFGSEYRSCQVHIHVGEGAVDDMQYAKYIVHVSMILLWNESVQVVTNLGFIDNTWMTTYCEVVGANGDSLNKPTMTHLTYKNGTVHKNITNQLAKSPNYHELQTFYLNALNNKDYDENEIACFFVNKSMYPTWKTGVRLKYFKEWWTVAGNAEAALNELTIILLIISIPMTFMIIIITTCWIFKDKIAAKANDNNKHDSHGHEHTPCTAADMDTRSSAITNNESRSSTPNNIDYQEIYDIIYEDRKRIERVRRMMNQTKNAPRPCPPPVETIPLRERVVPPPTSDSLIPPSDRYLLYLDSEGYEIPDETRFITLPCISDD